MALKYADYGYIMESGRIVMDGSAKDLASNEDVKEFYLGVGGGERKSFKDVKATSAASAGWPENPPEGRQARCKATGPPGSCSLPLPWISPVSKATPLPLEFSLQDLP